MDELTAVIEKNFPEQVRFLQKLVQTKSANPFTPDKSDSKNPIELEVAKLIEKKFGEIGFKPKRVALFPKLRPNLVVKIKGKKPGRTLIFNGHMDTVVPVSTYSFDPYAAVIKEGKLFGVGSMSLKGSLSCLVFMAKALRDLKMKLSGDIILTFVVDEEPASSSPYGTAYLLKKSLGGDAAIVTEPRTDKIVIGHRGRYLFKITTFGEAAHTGMKEWEKGIQGHNAILDMTKIINHLADLKLPSSPSPVFPGVKSVFTFPTIIEGGKAINIVPEKCIAYGDSRLLPSVSPEEVKRLIKQKLEPLKKDIRFKIEEIIKVWGVEIDPKEEIVQTLLSQVKKVLKKTPRVAGCRPSDDGWMFIKKGIPTVCGFGPDGAGAHGRDEWVDLESVKKVTEIYARVAIDFLGRA